MAEVNALAGKTNFTLHGSKAKPSLFFAPRSVVLHLGNNFNPGGMPAYQVTGNIRSLIRGPGWDGFANFELDTNDSAKIDKFEFGFIQILSAGQCFIVYAGKSPNLGSVVFDLGFDGQSFVDSDPAEAPYQAPPASRQVLAGADGQCPTQDHPNLVIPNTVRNMSDDFKDSPSVVNLVQFVKHSMSFITVLTQREKTTNQVTPLGSFRWDLSYVFELKYAGAKLTVRNASHINFKPFRLGEPDFSGEERRLWQQRPRSFFNDQFLARLKQAFGQPSSFRRDRKDWILSVPKDFST